VTRHFTYLDLKLIVFDSQFQNYHSLDERTTRELLEYFPPNWASCQGIVYYSIYLLPSVIIV
jgi:hypothetical protein